MARGRPHGALNKRTIEAREEHLLKFRREMEHANAVNKKLPKQHLEEMATFALGMAAAYQPSNPRLIDKDPSKANPHADWGKFWECMRFAKEVLAIWAPYVHPTYKAIAIATPSLGNGTYGPIDPDDPVQYPTVEEIRQTLARRGLPPLKDIITIDEITDDE